MSDSSEHLELMLEVVQQETAKLEALRDEVKGLLASAKSLRVELQQDTRQLSVDRRGVASTVETEAERVKTELKADLDAKFRHGIAAVANVQKNGSERVYWVMAGVFVLTVVLSGGYALWMAVTLKNSSAEQFSSQTDRLAIIEKRLKIKN